MVIITAANAAAFLRLFAYDRLHNLWELQFCGCAFILKKVKAQVNWINWVNWVAVWLN